MSGCVKGSLEQKDSVAIRVSVLILNRLDRKLPCHTSLAQIEVLYRRCNPANQSCATRQNQLVDLAAQ